MTPLAKTELEDLLRLSQRADKTLELATTIDKAFNPDGDPVKTKANLKLAIMAAIGDSESYGYDTALKAIS